MPRDRRAVPYTEFSLTDIHPTDIISDGFRVSELVRSDIATRRGIVNWFESDSHLQAAIYLTREILTPLRDKFGPFSPTSVYRTNALERVLKGKPSRWVSKSQHTRGEAADIEIPGIPNRALAEYIKEQMEFDQLILECYDPAVPNSGWVHVSMVDGGEYRHEALSYVLEDSVWVYRPGLLPA